MGLLTGHHRKTVGLGLCRSAPGGKGIDGPLHRKRTVDNRKMGKAILTAAAMGAALIGAFWWLAVTFLP